MITYEIDSFMYITGRKQPTVSWLIDNETKRYDGKAFKEYYVGKLFKSRNHQILIIKDII